MSGRIEQLLRNNQAFVAAQLALDPGYLPDELRRQNDAVLEALRHNSVGMIEGARA